MISDKKRIHTKEQLNDWLNYELKNYGGKKKLDFLMLSEKAILKKHQILLRKSEYYLNTNKKFQAKIYNIRLRRLQIKYSMTIPLNSCERGLRIMHLGPILINNNVSVGKNCKLHINTGIVAGGTTDETPKLGDNIVIGMGAVVLGGIELADNIAIGANSVVNKSFTEQSISIAGAPAKKISNNGSDKWGKNTKKT